MSKLNVTDSEHPINHDKHYVPHNTNKQSYDTVSKISNVGSTNATEDSYPFDSSNIEADTKKYIKAFVVRQKMTNECIDINNIRARTQKFDSKKESMLPANELDERGRPRSQPFNNYITTQLFETTFNCTEQVGTAELLDTIQALSSTTCSSYYAR